MYAFLHALAWSTPALAVPETDPAEKIVPLDAPADTSGTWDLDNAGLHLVRADPVGKYNYWLSKDWKLQSGLIRARVAVSGKLDSTLLFRASAPEGRPENLSGYGFSFEGDAIGFYRWNDGVVVPLGAITKIPGLQDRDEVEVVVWAVGPQIAAIVYDGTTLAQLGALAVHDATYASGRLGWRAHPGQGSGTRLEKLSVLATEVGARAATPATDAFGVTRLVEVDTSAAGRIPEHIELVERGETVTTVLATPEQVEQMRRRGILIRRQTGYVGRWATDAVYRERRESPFVQTPTGFDFSGSYKDGAMVEASLRAMNARWPDVTSVVQIGTSGQGRPMWALRVTDHPERDEDEPAVLLDGAHHGTELLSVEYALDAAAWTLEHQHEPRVAAWIAGLDLWFVPMVNVDGNHAYWNVSSETGRKNMRDTDGDGAFEFWEGVDLNRNYPFAWGSLAEEGSRSWPNSAYYRGADGGSEPETQVMMALARRYHFAAAISWHTFSTVIISPYSAEGQQHRNPTPDVPGRVASDIAATMPIQPNKKKYKVVREIYDVDGVDQDWHYFQHGTLAYIVEGSHHNPKDAGIRAASIAGVRPFYQGLMDRLVEGPHIVGHVLDDRGRPVEAAITIDEYPLNNGENWTSRADGRFDRIVLAPGVYTVHARAEGHGDAVAQVTVGDDPAEVTLMTPRLVAGD